jgi:hypothetical protein
MKIKDEHFKLIEAGVLNAIDGTKFAYPEKALDVYRKNNLSDKRWRWDMFWLASRRRMFPENLITKIYQYANDEHLDTCLRKITGTK